MNAQEFYDAVAAIFNETHDYVPPPSGALKKRWGPRTPGNGRFPGRGIVRFFSPTVIHVALRHPSINGQFADPDAALTAIKQAHDLDMIGAFFSMDHDFARYRYCDPVP